MIKERDDFYESDGEIEFETYFHLKKSYLLIFIMIFALFLRLYNTRNTSLWTDEIGTCWIASAPTLGETASRAVQTQGQSPLYFVIVRFFLIFLPVNELTLRLPSILASVFSVFLIFYLAMLLFDDSLKSLVASLIFCVNSLMIFYGQEARPYAIGLMFVLLSQIYFHKYLARKSLWDLPLNILFTILAIYTHYVFAGIIIVQFFYLVFRSMKTRKGERFKLTNWIVGQLFIALSIGLMSTQIHSMMQNRQSWNWLNILSFWDALINFLMMFNPFILVFVFICFLIFLSCSSAKDLMEYLNCERFVGNLCLLCVWIIVPFFFVCGISYGLGVSLFDWRYLIMSIIPFCLLLADFLCIFSSPVFRIAFPSTYFLVYLGLVIFPDCAKTGSFCKRIPHDWRNAIKQIEENFEDNDAILLRFGEVRENWIPALNNPLISEYVSSPFRIFYWKKGKVPPVYNLTYTWEKDFEPYYDIMFRDLQKHKRVWLIGVDTPNTNYPLSNISILMVREFYWTRLAVGNYSGVQLCLLDSSYIPGDKKN